MSTVFGGERGPTGDHGQEGPEGREGIEGPEGDRGPLGLTGAVGPAGPPGPQGREGSRGRSGARGRRGFGVPTVAGPYVLSTVQTVVLFLFVVTAFAVVSIRTEIQQRQIRQTQAAIAINTHNIQLAQWQGCVGGVAVVKRFNAGQVALARVEKTRVIADKELITERVKIILNQRVLPEPTLEQCGPKP